MVVYTHAAKVYMCVYKIIIISPRLKSACAGSVHNIHIRIYMYYWRQHYVGVMWIRWTTWALQNTILCNECTVPIRSVILHLLYAFMKHRLLLTFKIIANTWTFSTNMSESFKSILTMSSPNVLDQSHQIIFYLMILETPCWTEQLGYMHMLATEDAILK